MAGGIEDVLRIEFEHIEHTEAESQEQPRLHVEAGAGPREAEAVGKDNMELEDVHMDSSLVFSFNNILSVSFKDT